MVTIEGVSRGIEKDEAMCLVRQIWVKLILKVLSTQMPCTINALP